jgi:hypothetical protein
MTGLVLYLLSLFLILRTPNISSHTPGGSVPQVEHQCSKRLTEFYIHIFTELILRLFKEAVSTLVNNR